MLIIPLQTLCTHRLLCMHIPVCKLFSVIADIELLHLSSNLFTLKNESQHELTKLWSDNWLSALS